MQRFCKTVCLLLLSLPFLLTSGGLSILLMQPRNWPAVGLVLVVAWMLRSVPSRSLRIKPSVIASLVLYLTVLLAAMFRQSALAGGRRFQRRGAADFLFCRAGVRGRMLPLLTLFIGLPRSVRHLCMQRLMSD
ncbi:MAG UNVERIFIED_CONTAM: hypothetical protein LVR18_13585 [Planctomycetaceae bacterium]|jgi:hypothetical protein